DADNCTQEADVIFVSVNTLTKKSGVSAGFAADLNYVELATRRIARDSTTSKDIVEKIDNVVTAISDLFGSGRVLIGSLQTEEGKNVCKSFHHVCAHWVPTERTPHRQAGGICAVRARGMLAQRISAINALSAICEATSANIDEVAMQLDVMRVSRRDQYRYQLDVSRSLDLRFRLILATTADYLAAQTQNRTTADSPSRLVKSSGPFSAAAT
ncbi:UDP-glucose 6-dehydrogenase 1, partial [Ceratobasidium sp. 395]